MTKECCNLVYMKNQLHRRRDGEIRVCKAGLERGIAAFTHSGRSVTWAVPSARQAIPARKTAQRACSRPTRSCAQSVSKVVATCHAWAGEAACQHRQLPAGRPAPSPWASRQPGQSLQPEWSVELVHLLHLLSCLLCLYWISAVPGSSSPPARRTCSAVLPSATA